MFGEGGKALQSKQGEVLFFIDFLVWDNRTGEGRTEMLRGPPGPLPSIH